MRPLIVQAYRQVLRRRFVPQLQIVFRLRGQKYLEMAMEQFVHGTKEGGLRSRSRWSCFGEKGSRWIGSIVFQKYSLASFSWHGITRLRFWDIAGKDNPLWHL